MPQKIVLDNTIETFYFPQQLVTWTIASVSGLFVVDAMVGVQSNWKLSIGLRFAGGSGVHSWAGYSL